MSGGSLRGSLPEVYGPLLPAFFDHEAPREEKATCGSCAMCAPAGVTTTQEMAHFRPDAKCCTFHPLLPNYLVGAILADERADMQEGRRRIREKIAAGIGVTPGWLAPPRKVDLLLKVSRQNAFGRSLTLLCPYFERAEHTCTIWRHRESVCTTFYCKHTNGADGHAFWTALRSYGVWLESALSAYSAGKVMPGHVEPKPLSGDMTLEELEDRPPPEGARAAAWKEWRGREEEFYVRCFEVVRGLSREGFEELSSGEEASNRLRKLAAAREAMLSPKLPERLVPNPEMTSDETATGVLVVTYSRYEPLMLTPDLFAVVRAFGEGGTVAEVRERLLREHDVEVPDALLVGLYQFRVLVPPAGGDVLVHPGS